MSKLRRYGDRLHKKSFLQGFGKDTLGGNGGTVIRVTNRNDNGFGSFREALLANYPRIIVFDVDGDIDLSTDKLDLDNDYCTILGKSSPNNGVTINGACLEIGANHVIVDNLRIHLGPVSNLDCIDILAAANNVYVKNCSLHWSVDETLGLSGRNITIENCIIAHPLNVTEFNPPTGHAMAVLQDTNGNTTIINCLFAHSHDRHPLLGYGNNQFINNVVYNYGKAGGGQIFPFQSSVHVDLIGNVYIPGLNTPSTPSYRKAFRLFDNVYAGSPDPELVEQSTVFLLGNRDVFRTNDSLPETDCVDSLIDYSNNLLSAPHTNFPQISYTSADFVRNKILNNAGAFPRDNFDINIINDVINGTGNIIDNPSEVGG